MADLFTGLGTFALPLAAQGAGVLAVEGAQETTAALATAVRSATSLASGLRVAVDYRDLFRRPLKPAELDRFDAVVFDPPRSGAVSQVTELAASKVPVAVAVSCNPNTFARDAAILVAGGYVLERLWPVAQFRWSTHVELVASFRR